MVEIATLKAAIAFGKTLVVAGKRAHSGALQDQFDASARRVNEEVGQIAFAVCKAIIAHAFGRPPNSDEV
jgi:hypothetical protein